MSKVSVIVLSYNAKNVVLECLRSVFALNYPNYEVIVVDNGSTDGSCEAIKKAYPRLKLIHSRSNLGRTGGYNLSLEYTTGDYILFLDQDTVVDTNMLSELVNAVEANPVIGAAGPKIYYYEDPRRIWSVGTSVSLLTGRTSFLGSDQIDKGQFDHTFEVQQHPTAILVKSEVINKIKGYDEDIFMVYCDSDFCLKIREVGYKIVSVPTAKLWHKEKVRKSLKMSRKLGMKSPSMAFLIGRNRIIFMKKHSARTDFLLFLLFFLPMILLFYLLICVIEARKDLLLSFLRGTVSGFKYAILNGKSSSLIIDSKGQQGLFPC